MSYCRSMRIILLLAVSLSAGTDAGWGWVTKIDDAVKAVLRSRRVARTAKALGRIRGALPEDEIVELAVKCRKAGGLDDVGKILGKARYADDVLEDAYLRIAVKNGRLSRETAEEAFSRMRGTEGLRTLARKINTANDSVAKGHIQELLIGNAAKRRGFRVLAFGRRFDDGVKKGATDIDVLVKHGKTSFAIESKAHAGAVPADVVRADAKSLLEFCRSSPGARPVFSFRTKPSPRITAELRRNGIEVLHGTPEELCTQLEMIARVSAN